MDCQFVLINVRTYINNTLLHFWKKKIINDNVHVYTNGLTYDSIHRSLWKPVLIPQFHPHTRTFISSASDKMYCGSVHDINNNQIFVKFHSAFCSHHNPETALIKVSNNLLLTADSGLYSVFILLDLSSVYDTLDHTMLISHFNILLCITANAFIKSFLQYICWFLFIFSSFFAF